MKNLDKMLLMMKNKKIVLWSLISLVVVLLIAIGIYTSVELKKNFGRGVYRNGPKATTYFYDHYSNEYKRTRVSFVSGKNTLQGFIYGQENTKGLIVFAHGIGSGHETYISVILGMVDRGWRVFTYDATGCAESEGKGTKGLPQSALDLDKALSYVENDPELSKLPVFVMGHSWGGYASAAVLNFDHDIKAVYSMSGYYKPLPQLSETAEDMLGSFEKVVRPFMAISNFMGFGKYAGLSAVKGINKKNIPVLISHGTEDEVIGFNTSSIISQKEKIKNPKVEYFIFDKKNQNGHNSFLDSDRKIEYKAEIQEKLNILKSQYDNEIPENVQIEWIQKLDKTILSEVNDEVLNLADGFFTKEL